MDYHSLSPRWLPLGHPRHIGLFGWLWDLSPPAMSSAHSWRASPFSSSIPQIHLSFPVLECSEQIFLSLYFLYSELLLAGWADIWRTTGRWRRMRMATRRLAVCRPPTPPPDPKSLSTAAVLKARHCPNQLCWPVTSVGSASQNRILSKWGIGWTGMGKIRIVLIFWIVKI